MRLRQAIATALADRMERDSPVVTSGKIPRQPRVRSRPQRACSIDLTRDRTLPTFAIVVAIFSDGTTNIRRSVKGSTSFPSGVSPALSRDAVSERIEILISELLALPHPDAAAIFRNIYAPSDD